MLINTETTLNVTKGSQNMITTKEQLPLYLQKYIVDQDSSRYTPIDQLVWKYIIRQLKSFLKIHGHPIYLKGMDATGITEERIPLISELSARLSKFGWTALPVSGFIPPAAFMELQSLGILPIASDMRTLGHLMYTPAPDIVHEAAGHAPILIDPEYTDYLRQYAKVAKKAIISQEDLDIYRAIRELSDIKENPHSTPQDIQASELKLQSATQNVSHISEATQLSRMNWWTAEYGLIGTLEDPKIFGAGLLSSVGESKWCLGKQVKKLPLTIECINKSYDITEPQPQLFVTPHFQHLKVVLKELADQMAFSVGGLSGLNKAILAKTVNTAELNSGIQISGVHTQPICVEGQNSSKNIIYLKTQGPTQISILNQEIPGQDKHYHQHGYGTPLGYLNNFPSSCPSALSLKQWKDVGLASATLKEIQSLSSVENQNGKMIHISQAFNLKLNYESGVRVEGKVKSLYVKNSQILLMSLTEAKATYGEAVLFEPAWGVYDIIFGTQVTSVFGGPADHFAFGEVEDFVAKRVLPPQYSEADLLLQKQYQQIQDWQNNFNKLNLNSISFEFIKSTSVLFQTCLQILDSQFTMDWLLRLEIYEWMGKVPGYPDAEKKNLLKALNQMMNSNAELKELIGEGLSLIPQNHGSYC